MRSVSFVMVLSIALAVRLHQEAFSFSLIPTKGTARPGTARSVFSSEATSDAYEGDNSRRRAEFKDLEPLEETAVRRARIEHDNLNQERFVKYGNELWELRKVMRNLSVKLVAALSGKSKEEQNKIRKQLRKVEKQDPELTYKLELEDMQMAERDGRLEDAEKHRQIALSARSCLPQFNLEGLWVGKYGEHGYEMINITYAGDHLVAYKVTGDKNVPKGEITFQVDLNPLPPLVVGGKPTESLQPIMLTEKAAKKWGTSQLPRSKGLGQVAEPGFKNSQWMEGQLILIGDEYFSFAWVPIEQQIFFGRPSPELALKMLRDSGSSSVTNKVWEAPPSLDDDVDVLKDFVSSCLDKTAETFDELEISDDPLSCIWHESGTEECYFQ